MKKYIWLIFCIILAACSKEMADDSGSVSGHYSITVKAAKVKTKALTLSGSTITTTWEEGDEVSVYNGASLLGTITAQNTGANTTLKGELDGEISTNDVLTLKFLSPSYSTQDGTLTGNATSIDKVCDYAEATITVKSKSDNKITIKESTANFSNYQAIVKFTLLDKINGNAPVNATGLTVSDGTNTYTVIPTSATSELFVAIPGISNKTVTLTATDGSYSYNYEKPGVTFSTGMYYEITVKASALSGAGTEGNPYLISSVDNWNYLVSTVNNGNSYSEKFFRQTANINVTTMVGIGTSKPFSGTYDGDGKTLNLNLNTTEPHTAPFRFIANATIKNVITTGSVYSTNNHPAGLVGITDGTCTIQNCLVSANVGGAQHSGGVVGHSWHANISIIGCVYSGTLTPASGQFTGGIIGWGGDGGGHTMSISNCLFAGSVNGSTTFHPVGIVQNTNNTRTVSNTYYTVAHNMNNEDTHGNSFVNGRSNKGKFARSITAGADVTISGLGASSATYNVSGITAYTHGIKYNDDFYAGNGEEVSLTLSHAAAPTGFTFSQYTVTGGGTLANPTSNSPTLTMADANQTINAEWIPQGAMPFNYTGAVQTFTALATGYYTLTCYGAQGGNRVNHSGGYGGMSQLIYYLTRGSTLYIYVGGQGGSITTTNNQTTGGSGGWNGGGTGGEGVRWHDSGDSPYSGGGGGGGATHIATSAIGPITSGTSFSVNHTGLILIAAGGGGATAFGDAGRGGGETGDCGSNSGSTPWSIDWNNGTYSCGRNGEKSAAGSCSCEGCGGGGAGYLGGNSWRVSSIQWADYECYSGAGGSSWGDETNGKGYFTTPGGATAGGNGKAVITWYGTTYPAS